MVPDHFLLRFFLIWLFGFILICPAGLLFARNRMPANAGFLVGAAFGIAVPLILFVPQIDGVVVGTAAFSGIISSVTLGLIARGTARWAGRGQ